MPNTQDFSEWLHSHDAGSCTDDKAIGGGLYVAIKPLIYHWTMIVGEIGDKFEYLDRWCYADQSKAKAAFDTWDGTGEPSGWHRHPATGRRRPDGDASKEFIAP